MPAAHRVHPRRRADRARASSSRSCSSPSRAARSRASTRWSSSGTTPKMIERETDARMIGYGAMLIEGLVGVVALIAAASLHPGDYFAINIARRQTFADARDGSRSNLAELSRRGRRERRRAAPAARSRSRSAWRRSSPAIPGMRGADGVLVPLRDHVRGAVHPDHDRHRHARRRASCCRSSLGSVHTPLGQTRLAARAAIVSTGADRRRRGATSSGPASIDTIWPMFGIANQLLAVRRAGRGDDVPGQHGPRALRAGDAAADAVRGDHHADRRVAQRHHQLPAARAHGRAARSAATCRRG